MDYQLFVGAKVRVGCGGGLHGKTGVVEKINPEYEHAYVVLLDGEDFGYDDLPARIAFKAEHLEMLAAKEVRRG